MCCCGLQRPNGMPSHGPGQVRHRGGAESAEGGHSQCTLACAAVRRLKSASAGLPTSSPAGLPSRTSFLPAERLTRYSRAIRCKWLRVKTGTCVDCVIPGSKLQDAWVGGAAVAAPCGARCPGAHCAVACAGPAGPHVRGALPLPLHAPRCPTQITRMLKARGWQAARPTVCTAGVQPAALLGAPRSPAPGGATIPTTPASRLQTPLRSTSTAF